MRREPTLRGSNEKTEALPGGQGLRTVSDSYLRFAALRRRRAGFFAAAFFAGLRFAALRRFGAAFFRVVFLAYFFAVVLRRRFGAALRAVFFAATVRFFAGARFLVAFFARRFLGGIGCHP